MLAQRITQQSLRRRTFSPSIDLEIRVRDAVYNINANISPVAAGQPSMVSRMAMKKFAAPAVLGASIQTR
jgi:hypothetical protein